ncbi:MAG: hypothetical protein SFY95_12280 [Planctomycetota bacterium]|nr:hypothetical protein [Planctomycetota bacterium]
MTAQTPGPVTEPATDRWAHRRVEPRGLALLWVLYLSATLIVAFSPASLGGVLTYESNRVAARDLLTLVAMGVCVLWPMLRLSQSAPSQALDRERPASGARASIRDFWVIAVPAQLIIWPQALFTGWPIAVTAAVAAMVGAWALLTAGMLALIFAKPGPVAGSVRAVAMAGAMTWLALGPVFGFAASELSGGGEATTRDASLWAMLSPMTAVFELTADRFWSGAAATVLGVHWAAIATTGLLAAGAWVLAFIRAPITGASGGAGPEPSAPQSDGAGPPGAGALDG